MYAFAGNGVPEQQEDELNAKPAMRFWMESDNSNATEQRKRGYQVVQLFGKYLQTRQTLIGFKAQTASG